MTDESPEAGFTLLEVLIALAIVGGVVAALVGIIDTARRLQASVDVRHQRQVEAAQLRGVLHDALSQLRTVAGASSLVGDRRRIAITAEAPRPLGMAEPVVLGLDPGEDGRGLIATWRRLAEGASLPAPLRLIATDREVRFDYLAAEGEWTPSWDRSGRIPLLLRVTIADVDLRTDATVLQFAPRALASPDCARGANTAGCGAHR